MGYNLQKDRNRKRQKLKKARYINGLIESNNEELKKLRLISESVRGTNYFSKESKSLNRVKGRDFEVVEDIVLLENKIQEDNNKLISAKKEVKELIDTVVDYECKLLLQYYYLNCKDWREIEHLFGRGRDSLNKIHARGIDMIRI